MGSDLSSNAAKANAMKTYDAKNSTTAPAAPGSSTGATSGGSAGGNGAQGGTSGYPSAPAPVVIYNNNNSGSSGPGFFSGLLLGNMFSSRHNDDRRYESNNVQQPSSGPMNAGPNHVATHQNVAEKSSFPWFTVFVVLLLSGAAIFLTCWLMLRKRNNSPAKNRRYSL